MGEGGLFVAVCSLGIVQSILQFILQHLCGEASGKRGERERDWMRRFLSVLFCWLVTGFLVFLGLGFGYEFLPLLERHPSSANRTDFAACLANWDGEWYASIATSGYQYDPQSMSNVVFFPGYPTLVRLFHAATGLRVEWALCIVSNLLFLAALDRLSIYTLRRFPDAPPQLHVLVLWSLAASPLALFFRVGYSESLFLLLLILALDAMRQQRPVWQMAFIVGAATGVRPVGVALLLPLWMSAWQQRTMGRTTLWQMLWTLPMSVWGLLAYMIHLSWVCGDPLAFAKNQSLWIIRPLPEQSSELVWQLMTLAPIRDVYNPESIAHWRNYPPSNLPIFNLHFANPWYIFITVLLIVFGAAKRFLQVREIVLAGLLLLIPYLLKSHPVCMMSQARYTVVVFPAYIVLGCILSQLSTSARIGWVSVSVSYLLSYSALFAAWYWIL